MSSESGYKVPTVNIKEIKEHPNAHSLEIAVVFGFEVVIAKGIYVVGEPVLYIPIDSIIPIELERELFPEGSKIKLSKHRVRQIRIRKFPSQGMLVKLPTIKKVYNIWAGEYDTDYSKKLNITKYEPQVRGSSFTGQGKKRKRLENSNFRKYNGLGNVKWFPDTFKEGELVVIQEKLHGTNARAGIFRFEANTIWKKIKKFFRLTPEFEFCYGSNNVQLQDQPNRKGYYGEDVYGAVFKELDAQSKLKNGEAIYGEIYGSGIQKNYSYGCKEGEHKFALFDVEINGKWLDPDAVITFAEERGFNMIPEIFRGEYNAVDAKAMTLGPSLINSKQAVREGIVIKASIGYDTDMGGKKALKLLSEKYLDKEQTEYH